MNKEIVLKKTCPRTYPDCGSPHVCDMCKQIFDLEKQVKELEDRVRWFEENEGNERC